MCNINHPKFPSKICAKNVQDKYKVLQCDLCELWMTSVKFGFILNVTTFIIQTTGIFKTVMNPSIAQNIAAQSFLSIPYLATKTSWLAVLTLTVTSHSGKIQKTDRDSSLLLKPSSDLEFLVNQFNNAKPENGNDPAKITSSKYHDIDEIHSIEIPHKNKPFSLFHINACSLNKIFDDLQYLLSCSKKFFDIFSSK